MTISIYEVFIGSWIVLAVLIAVTLAKVHGALEYLKTHHKQSWSALGEPSLFLNNSPRTNFLFLRFLLRREFEAVRDIELDKRCRMLLRLYVAATVLFVLVLLMLPFL